MNTSQEVYEDINTDELSHSVLSGQNEISMQNVKRSVDIEEVQQNITDDNLCDKNNFDFLPRECILRYTKISANFNINDFERSESEPNTDNNSDNSVYNRLHELHKIFEDYSCLLLELFQDTIVTSSIHNN